MNDSMLPLPGLSSVSGKPVVVKFDGGLLSSDGGILALREVEQHIRLADRLAACIVDPRAPDQITHSLAEIIRFRLHHWGMLFEAAILSTLLSVGSEVGTSNNENSLVQAIRQGASQSFNQTGEQVVGRSLNVQPTITIRPGFPVRVMVTHDLVLEPYA